MVGCAWKEKVAHTTALSKIGSMVLRCPHGGMISRQLALYAGSRLVSLFKGTFVRLGKLAASATGCNSGS